MREFFDNAPFQTSSEVAIATPPSPKAIEQVAEPAPETAPPNPAQLLPGGNNVDELRYLFICSQVELLDSPASLTDLEYAEQSDAIGVGVTKADGHKCERCWNYSTHVGDFPDRPTVCERCNAALDGEF